MTKRKRKRTYEKQCECVVWRDRINQKGIKQGRKLKSHKLNEVKIATWNVRTMLVPGKMQEIGDELRRYNVNIAALQEIRWKGQGVIDKPEFTVRYSGSDKQGQYGVAFMIMGKMRDNIIEYRPISERLAYLRIRAKPFNISLLNIYAPTEKARDEEKDRFYEKLEEELENIPKEDTQLILGDFNAQIGREEYLNQVAGEFTIHKRTNNNGHRVCNMAARTNLVISSTKFQHHSRHKATWMSPDQKTCSQIDHVLINKRMQSAIKDVRTYRGACVDSDHFMVCTTMRQKIKNVKNSKRMGSRWNVEKLHNGYNQKKFAEEMRRQLRNSEEANDSVEAEWNSLKKCITQTAETQVGKEGKVNKRDWYNEECRDILMKKRSIRSRWLGNKRQEDREEYEKARRDCNKMMRKTKRKWIDSKMDELEREYRNTNTRSYYRKISEQNRVYKGRPSGIKNSDGKVIEETEEYKRVWMEYFKQLLNDPSVDREEMQEETEGREEETVPIPEPTLEEVKQVINSSRNGKTPGKDGINIELLKYGGEELQERVYMLLRRIWEEENMPQEWRTGQVVTIHKKGDQHMCRNYRGITLLNVVYKILSTLVQRRLADATRDIIGNYQLGFRQGKSTIDAIHTVKQIMEKAYEYKIETEMLFIDFEGAFDSIKREELMKALKELGINPKLIRLIEMTMRRTTVSVKTLKGETEEFEINRGVRQGDSLSALLFNIALEYVLRNISKGTLRTRGGQLIAYADDIVLVTKNRRIMKEMLLEIVEEGAKMGLKLNENKTKFMRVGKNPENGKIMLGKYSFDEVTVFKYLGVMLMNTGEREADIRERILKANRAYHANKKMLKSKFLGKKTKLNVYRTIIRPVLIYAAETMTMSKRDEEDLRIFERKILRTILGPVIEEDMYRIRMNHELLQEVQNIDIVRVIKQQRVRWLGHVWRAGERATIYSMLVWDPGGKRRKGRPRCRWIQEVTEDIRRAGISNWKVKTADRREWRDVCRRI